MSICATGVPIIHLNVHSHILKFDKMICLIYIQFLTYSIELRTALNPTKPSNWFCDVYYNSNHTSDTSYCVCNPLAGGEECYNDRKNHRKTYNRKNCVDSARTMRTILSVMTASLTSFRCQHAILDL